MSSRNTTLRVSSTKSQPRLIWSLANSGRSAARASAERPEFASDQISRGVDRLAVRLVAIGEVPVVAVLVRRPEPVADEHLRLEALLHHRRRVARADVLPEPPAEGEVHGRVVSHAL